MRMSRRAVLATAGGAVAYAAAPQSAQACDDPVPAATGQELRAAADYAVEKVRSVAPDVTAFPVGTRFEKWVYSQNGDWVGGFWPGVLWMGWLHSGDDTLRALALDSAARLAPRRHDTGTHDLGFLFTPSWVTAWRLTGDTSWRDGAVQAARSLLQRYNPRGRYLRAWGALDTPDNAGRMIIDTMMNLDLLVFAARETGESAFLDAAVGHARTTRRLFPRPDGSIPHVYDLDPATGTPIGPNTVQGYSPTSAWARGQGWGVYGFTTMYRRTGDHEFLDTARRLADYAVQALGADHVPVWDYRAPQQPYDIKDASAGAVTACGLLDLAAATGHHPYRTTALRILGALCRTCLTTRSARAEAVVARCTRNRPAEDGIEISLPYADYYLLEAILRVLRPRELDRAIDLSTV